MSLIKRDMRGVQKLIFWSDPKTDCGISKSCIAKRSSSRKKKCGLNASLVIPTDFEFIYTAVIVPRKLGRRIC